MGCYGRIRFKGCHPAFQPSGKGWATDDDDAWIYLVEETVRKARQAKSYQICVSTLVKAIFSTAQLIAGTASMKLRKLKSSGELSTYLGTKELVSIHGNYIH